MLKQTQKFPYVGIFKTATGDEFIARVTEETMYGYSVQKPLCMVSTEQGLRFAPFLIMADSEKDVNIPKPVITASPAPQLKNQYESAISGIALPGQ